jgi:hypothetical protein
MAMRSPWSTSSRSEMATFERSRRFGLMSSASMDREVSSRITTSRPLRRICCGCGFHLGSVRATTMLTKATTSSVALNTCFRRLTVSLIRASIALLARRRRVCALRQKHQI